MNKNIGSGMIF